MPETPEHPPNPSTIAQRAAEEYSELYASKHASRLPFEEFRIIKHIIQAAIDEDRQERGCECSDKGMQIDWKRIRELYKRLLIMALKKEPTNEQ
jgi:hypothetical protein